MSRTFKTTTLTARPAPSMAAVLLRLVPTILTSGRPGRGRITASAAIVVVVATALQQTMMIKHTFLHSIIILSSCMVLLPKLNPANLASSIV